jgi:hypothetical protein
MRARASKKPKILRERLTPSKQLSTLWLPAGCAIWENFDGSGSFEGTFRNGSLGLYRRNLRKYAGVKPVIFRKELANRP